MGNENKQRGTVIMKALKILKSIVVFVLGFVVVFGFAMWISSPDANATTVQELSDWTYVQLQNEADLRADQVRYLLSEVQRLSKNQEILEENLQGANGRILRLLLAKNN